MCSVLQNMGLARNTLSIFSTELFANPPILTAVLRGCLREQVCFKKITNALFVWFWMVYVWLQMAEICFLKLLLDTINARQKAGQIIINFSIRTHEWWQQLIVGKIIEQILIFWYSIPWLCTLYDTNHNLYLFINLFLKKCFLTETVKTNKKKRAKINYWLID